jgi:hypothetical protein
MAARQDCARAVRIAHGITSKGYPAAAKHTGNPATLS